VATPGTPKPVAVAAKPQMAHAKPAIHEHPKAVAVKAAPVKAATEKTDTAKVSSAPESTPAGEAKSEASVQENKPAGENKEASKEIHFEGRRDPFISPVVAMSATGSGCSSGKRCLSIDQVALKGILKSESGMIAVVVNSLDKAYFLRENDPVFDGYVEKITGDSIVFKETFHDRLGKPLTRDVTKTITRPAV
jgi:Tfp pilus assembly protein PilP